MPMHSSYDAGLMRHGGRKYFQGGIRYVEY